MLQGRRTARQCYYQVCNKGDSTIWLTVSMTCTTPTRLLLHMLCRMVHSDKLVSGAAYQCKYQCMYREGKIKAKCYLTKQKCQFQCCLQFETLHRYMFKAQVNVWCSSTVQTTVVTQQRKQMLPQPHTQQQQPLCLCKKKPMCSLDTSTVN